MSESNNTQQEFFSAINVGISESNPANEQDELDGARYRWLASRINNGSLAIFQAITDKAQPWPNSEFEKIIDEGILVEQSLKQWHIRNDETE